MLGIVTTVVLIACAQALPSDLANRQPPKHQRFDVEERIARDGYYSESHDVITSDGYILEINRIPFGRFENRPSSPTSKPVVFLMHGLHNSAISFITLGPNVSIAYVLADAGYDVWMGNSRGAVNSRRHVTLDPNHPRDRRKFFDYTYEDIGLKDLPAMLDYTLEVTKKKQLNYIAHSQGGTAFFVLSSVKPQYNKIFKSVHLLGAVGYQRHFPTKLIRIIARRTDRLYALAVKLGAIELGPSPTMGIDESVTRLRNNADLEEAFLLSDEFLPGIPREIMATASMKQYAHFGQNIRDRRFRRWNYGVTGNLFRYGRLVPPAYNLRPVTAEITMHYSLGDILLGERDVLDMARDINAKVRRVARDSFSHTDFILSHDTKTLITDYIIENLNRKNKNI